MSKKFNRRILMAQLLVMDQMNDTSLVRELEVAVDTVVTFQPGYCDQFFNDVRIYGVDEAYQYLTRFVETRFKLDEYPQIAVDMGKISAVIKRIHDWHNGWVVSATSV